MKSFKELEKIVSDVNGATPFKITISRKWFFWITMEMDKRGAFAHAWSGISIDHAYGIADVILNEFFLED